MKKDKLVYEAPEAEIFEVKIDGRLLMGSNPGDGTDGGAGGMGTGNEYDLG